MNKILIFGSTGFVGKALSNYLHSNGFEVYPRDGGGEIKKNKIRLELSNIQEILNFINYNSIDTVLHLASNLVPDSSHNEFLIENTNLILATQKLISSLSKKNIRFIFFSSGGQVYKESASHHLETDTLMAQSYYGQSKILIEQEIIKADSKNNFPYIILRPSNIYGVRSKNKSSQGIIPIFLNSIVSKKEIIIYGDGSKIRDYIYINDVIRIVSELIKNKNIKGTFNLASNEEYTILEVLKFCENACDEKTKIVYRPDRSCDPHQTLFDNTKLIDSVNIDLTALEDGIFQMLNVING